MMQTQKEQNTNPSKVQAQRAYWISIGTGVIMLIVLVFFLIIDRGRAVVYWPADVRILISVLAVGGFISAWLVQRGKVIFGISLILGMYYISILLVTLSIANVGVADAAVVVVLTFGVTSAVMPSTRLARYANIFALVLAAGIVLLDVFQPFERAANDTPEITWGVATFLVLLYGVLIFRQFGSYNLRTKILLGIITLTMASVGTLAYTNYSNTQTNLTKSAGEGLKSLANSQADQVADQLQQQARLLQSFDLSKIVQDRVGEVNATYGTDETANLQQIHLLDQQWRAADAANNNNTPVVSGVLESEVASELTEFHDTFPEYTDVLVTDKYGALVAATNRTPAFSLRAEDWWQAAYNNGKGAIYFGQPVFNKDSKSFEIILAVPLVGHGNNEVIGITRTILKLDAVLNILSTQLSNGTIHSDLYLPNKQAIAPEDNAQAFRPSDPEALTRISALTTNTHYDIFTLDGVPSVVSAAQIKLRDSSEAQSAIEKLGWVILIDQNQVDYLAPVAQQSRTTILIALLILMVASIASIFMAQTLTNPIIRLTQTARQISDGNITLQAKVETGDEIGTLAGAFNRMTQQLRDFINTLEGRVAERTRNLELAAEVGRTTSQVRALDVTLRDAAELIREQFNLYYVQVYLVNPSQTYLNLQAGTGNVGVELLGRNHRLPFEANSINGRAAIDKKSVVISDTADSPTFKPNPLLPNTRSEMAVPLLIGDRVVGVLDMQSEQSGALSQQILPAFEALAGQLAITIQNATLLEEANQARAEVSAQARRLTRANWADYLDAIHKPEETGFQYEQNKITSLTKAQQAQANENPNALITPISVIGEVLGNLVVEMDGESPIARTEELLNTVARQVAQQIESLRLLDSAERYRAEAEEASRRLTREGWKEYLANANENISYVYDLNEVRVHDNNLDQDSQSTDLTVPLKVRDETVGKLSVVGLEEEDQESLDLVNAVADRLGAHIEGLRQYDQTQSALAQSENLFTASRSLTQSTTLQELVEAAVTALNIHAVNRALLAVFSHDSEGKVEGMEVVANWWNGSGFEATAVGTHYSSEQLRVLSIFTSATPIFFNDILNDERVDGASLEIVKRLKVRAMVGLPLFIGTRQLGTLILEAEEVHDFSQEDIRLFTSLAPQIATLLESRRQFEQAQQQAERESTLNTISQKIQSATTVEAVLQIAARELGHALGAPMTVAQLSMKEKNYG